jgi:FAD-linked sulfhydryl oxidase
MRNVERSIIMPVTEIPYPILSQFGCAVTKTTGMPPQPLDATPEQRAQVDEEDRTPKQLPKGVVLGPDGKPYVKRHCTGY